MTPNNTSLIVLVCLTVSLTSCTDNRIVSEGDRVGTVTKLSRKQMDCVFGEAAWNWEGELAMQGGTLAARQGITTDSQGIVSNQGIVSAFAFSLDPNEKSDSTVGALRDAMNKGRTVRLSYRQVNNHDSCKMGTDYIVTAVIPLN